MHLSARRLLAAVLFSICALATVGAQERSPAQPPPAPPPLTAGRGAQQPQDEFRPLSELPPEERLPAAPLLVTAYIFVVLALFAYLLSLSRRLSSVTKEISRLDAELKRGGRA